MTIPHQHRHHHCEHDCCDHWTVHQNDAAPVAGVVYVAGHEAGFVRAASAFPPATGTVSMCGSVPTELVMSEMGVAAAITAPTVMSVSAVGVHVDAKFSVFPVFAANAVEVSSTVTWIFARVKASKIANHCAVGVTAAVPDDHTVTDVTRVPAGTRPTPDTRSCADVNDDAVFPNVARGPGTAITPDGTSFHRGRTTEANCPGENWELLRVTGIYATTVYETPSPLTVESM